VSLPAATHNHYPILRQLADDLAQAVYRLTWKFMQSDTALAQRMRNAAITVGVLLATQPPPTARSSVRRAIFGAIVVLGELAYCLQFARRAGLIGDPDLKRVFAIKEELIQHLDAYLTGPSQNPAGTASH
jgi:hypothetical protein